MLAVVDEFTRDQVRQAAADEIYVREPVLMVVEPESLCKRHDRLHDRQVARIGAEMPDISIHPVRIGPVAFDRHRAKAAFDDQLFCDGRAGRIELMGAMRRFTNENKSGVADAIEQRIIIERSSIDWMCIFANIFDNT